jgi:hypothetical protein
MKLAVKIAYASTFEGGYFYEVEIERAIEGTPPAIAALCTPAWGPGGVENFWGFGIGRGDPWRGIVELADAAEDLESVEMTSPDPGRGLGSFLVPGVITSTSTYHRLLGWTPAS